MEKIIHYYTANGGRASAHQVRIIEEIAYLEGRLEEIGLTGDCAYEKSLARTYDTLLKERRQQLTESGIRLRNRS